MCSYEDGIWKTINFELYILFLKRWVKFKTHYVDSQVELSIPAVIISQILALIRYK